MNSWTIVWILIISISLLITIKITDKKEIRNLKTSKLSYRNIIELFLTFLENYTYVLLFIALIFISGNNLVANFIVNKNEIIHGQIESINVLPNSRYENNATISFKTVNNQIFKAYLSDELKNNYKQLSMKDKDDYCILIKTSDNYFYKTYDYKNIIIKCESNTQWFFLAPIIVLEIIFLCFYIIILILEKLEIEKINTQTNKKQAIIIEYIIANSIIILMFLILTLCLVADIQL